MAECSKCGFKTSNGAHERVCARVPRPDDLAKEYRSGQTAADLASKYEVGYEFIIRHLEMADEEVERKLYNTTSYSFSRCKRCKMFIFDDGDESVPSNWDKATQGNVDGYCPECAVFVESGHSPPILSGGILSKETFL
jgi:hypothetical protein